MNHKHFIFDYKNFNNENLILRTPETRNNNIIIPIKYNQPNQPNQKLKLRSLLFKTPKLYMPFKPNTTNNQGGYVRLSFDNLKIDYNLKLFYDFINNIDNYLQNEIINSNIINVKNKNDLNFKKTIKKTDGFPDYFNLNFNTNDIRVFDIDLNNIPIENVEGNFYAYFVIELVGFYYNKKIKQFKLIWNLVQFKLDKTKNIIDECLFLDEYDPENNLQIQIQKQKSISPQNTNETSKDTIKQISNIIDKPKEILKNNIILEKFFKMLSVGIPKPAIQHKMMLSSVDPKFLDYSPDTDINTLPIEMKQKIIVKDDNNDINTDNKKNNNNENQTSGGLLSSMINKLDFNNLQLKKTITNSKSQLPKEIIEKKDLRVPSLSEIQEARRKLFEKRKKEDIKNEDIKNEDKKK
jgi:hypothetical protein